MAIKNYTSSVAVINSIGNIEHRLAKAGVTHIGKLYSKDKSGRPIGMLFQIEINGYPRTFRLPAKVDKIFEYLKLQRKRQPTTAQIETIKQQACRTAWKILSDWIDLQVSMIELEQAEAGEVFFPYLYDGNVDKTIFEIAKEDNFQKLLSA